MKIGHCAVCDEKEKRIFDLIAQMETLKRLVFPKAQNQSLPIVDFETSRVVGFVENEEFTDAQKKDFEINMEANAILTGSYE